jgi:hypothetical protein
VPERGRESRPKGERRGAASGGGRKEEGMMQERRNNKGIFRREPREKERKLILT